MKCLTTKKEKNELGTNGLIYLGSKNNFYLLNKQLAGNAV